jgi:glycosyltransferase involved in cell wall biosynthesis
LSDSVERKVAVLIPAFNEGGAIAGVVRAVRALGVQYDAVVIDDSSEDNTASEAEREGACVLRLPVNLGIGGAVQTGYKYACSRGYDACVQVDGDGQHPPADIPRMLSVLFGEGYDLVIGSRFVEDRRYQVTFMRNLGIRILSLFLKLVTGIIVKDTTSGFRATNKRVMDLFAGEYPQDYPEPESLIFAHKCGLRVKEVPVTMHSRMYGKSSITPLRSAYYMVKVLLAMSVDLCRDIRG